ncbi:Lipoteichoic acid synthase 2 [Vibrio aerogenes CECT 7868]|uniref:Lipoteichoic acid synthase 2 n=1 Tax=Vibrio aerogenes CECT 7868 TaxID=1216006 RepID=A0A1M5V599_9VIBR|nr:LTA synthase family protein [Vibrio aerogenes]SHH70401.1 Lipoteichoic acid synthase 2 [Vibrio aerogenes CECT 7868]
MKKSPGPLFSVLTAGFSALIMLTLFRTGLALWQFDRVSAHDAWSQLLLNGLRVDIATVCWLLIVPAFLSCWLSGIRRLEPFWSLILRLWITGGLMFLIFMEVATPTFIAEYDLRPNRLFIEYLAYPKEVFTMLWHGYKLPLIAGTIFTTVAVIFIWRSTKSWTTNVRSIRWYWRPVLAILVLAFGIAGARSTLGHRPLNPAMVAFSTDPLLNDLTLNSSYSVLFAIRQISDEASAFQFYPKMAKADIIREIRQSMNVAPNDFISAKQPTLANHISHHQGQKKNIVVLLLESHGAQFIKSLGGIDASPHLDQLIHQGWAFKQMYATGTRSVRGIEAVVSGFPPTPSRSVVKLGKSQHNFFSVADLLKSQGYTTQFIYGGESHFDNMKSFFLGNGFTNIQDFPTFSQPAFVGSWGASDEDLYRKADEQFSRFSAENKPFFSLVFSSSNHSPFEYPAGRIKPYNTPADTVQNAVKYADYAIGKFFEKARQSNYWHNTIFVIVADHDARTYGATPLPVAHFHIPAIIIGDGVAPRQDDRLVSQLDLAPTMLSLAGISSKNPMIGFDLTQPLAKEKQRALMQRDKNFGWMTADHQVVLFEPGKPASTYTFDPKTEKLTPAPVAKSIIKRAHANAMWGSLAYQDDLYTAEKDYRVNTAQSGEPRHLTGPVSNAAGQGQPGN